MKPIVKLYAFLAFVVFSSFLTVIAIHSSINNKPIYSLDNEIVIIGQPTFSAYFTIFLAQTSNTIIKNSFPIAVGTWIIIGSLVWRGNVKRLMLSAGFDYDIFLTMIRMKGGQTRFKILNELELPKNRKQIAESLGFDWKAIDRHIKVLVRHQLISEIHQEGNAVYYLRTEKGAKFLKSFNGFTNSK